LCRQAGARQHDDRHHDLEHIMWIMKTMEPPFAELEARLDKALGCTTFTAQMAIMEDCLHVDASALPPALHAKWDRVLTRVAEATVLGECAPFGE
jgi:hypothetical protein